MINRKRLPIDLIAGLLVFVTTFVVLRVSPVHQLADAKFALLTSEQLWQHGSFTLDRRLFREIPPAKPETPDRIENPFYQLEQIGDRLYYSYPPGTSILSLPWVALMHARGFTTTDRDGFYNEGLEIGLQSGLACLLMAGLAMVVFHTSRLLLPLGWSVVIAASTAFGTQVWSTASRALWGDTWGILILGIVIWLLLRAEVKRGPPRPLLLATCLSWSYFARPTFCIPIVAITIFLLLYHRSTFVRYALTGGAWLALFVAYSRYHFGQNLPNYYETNRVTFETFWQGMAGSLFSPSRGLFIYVPVLIFVGYFLIRYRSSWATPRLVVLSVGVIIVHLVVIAGFVSWYGGHCYGPRYTTGLVPWFALLGILAVDARLRWRAENLASDSSARWRTERAIGALLLLCSMTLHGIGGISYAASISWNSTPINVDDMPSRAWDWSDPQFLRAVTGDR
jgi:hypothetical protein